MTANSGPGISTLSSGTYYEVAHCLQVKLLKVQNISRPKYCILESTTRNCNVLQDYKSSSSLPKCQTLPDNFRNDKIKDTKITSRNRPVEKPCCSGLPNGLPPLIASRILSLKLQIW
jgi:hypothetical protein